MQIVIDIPETLKKIADEEDIKTFSHLMWSAIIMDAIRNGTPIPEHHGRLIDADELYGDFIDGTEGYDCQTWNRIEIGDIIDYAPTIIEGSNKE